MSLDLKILFVLPVSGGGGGAHSVMQEAEAMISLGVSAGIACNELNANRLRTLYYDLRKISTNIFGFEGTKGLAALIDEGKWNVIVATTNQSAHVLRDSIKICKRANDLKIGYYIQDYEPLFYEKDSHEWIVARSSYGLIPNAIHFAKTQWLQEVVNDNHRVEVQKVIPSIDHHVYYPDFSIRYSNKLVISAMVRPATPRRAPYRTLRILNKIAQKYGDNVEIFLFGSSDVELDMMNMQLTKGTNLGVLRREQVARLFRRTDLFLDLSDFQAFGRSAIEAMACGAVSTVPIHGGTSEYAKHYENSFVVDTRYDNEILHAVDVYLNESPEKRKKMSLEAVKASFAFSPEAAALSEIKLFL